MRDKRYPILLPGMGLLLLFIPLVSMSQLNASRVKTGWTFGVLPVIGYNTDIGFKYGGLVSVYDYGKETTYPVYRKMFRLEISRSTKGSGINQLFFDSDRLLGNSRIRFTADLSWLTDKVCDFYGFNGKEANYDHSFTEDQSPSYISRVYYAMDRRLFRFTADFKGPVTADHLHWIAGLGVYEYMITTVDIKKLNKGKDDDDMLPDTALLYDKYVVWNLIPSVEADGGHQQVIKAGIVYDSRDIEANPAKGIWTELIFIAAPSFLWNDENAFTRLALTHRQYFTLFPNQLTLVYRIGYQGRISGNVPFYSMPYIYGSYLSSVIEEGLGGAKSLRGILRNRLTGDGVAFANIEFRWKFLRGVLWKQNFYLALNPFLDAGMVVQKVPVEIANVPPQENIPDYFTGENESMHFSSGCGLHLALNENFVVAADIGYALSKLDGGLGVYIGINWLF
jgi:hypothetical protein